MSTTTYTSQAEQLNNNLQKWSTFINTMTSIINQYQSTVDSLQEQISDNAASIAGLKAYIDSSLDVDFIKLDTTTIDVESSPSSRTPTPSYVNVFSSADTVYVTASKTLSGLYINAVPVTKGQFYEFGGSVLGDKLSITAVDVKKTGDLTLSFDVSTSSVRPTSLTVKVKANSTTNTIEIKPITNTADLASRFTSAINGLNGITVVTSSSTNNTSTSLSQQETLTNLSSQLLGSNSVPGVAVKKNNLL